MIQLGYSHCGDKFNIQPQATCVTMGMPTLHALPCLFLPICFYFLLCLQVQVACSFYEHPKPAFPLSLLTALSSSALSLFLFN